MAIVIPPGEDKVEKEKKSLTLPTKGRFGVSLVLGKKEFFVGLLIDNILTGDVSNKSKRLERVGRGRAVTI